MLNLSTAKTLYRVWIFQHVCICPGGRLLNVTWMKLADRWMSDSKTQDSPGRQADSRAAVGVHGCRVADGGGGGGLARGGKILTEEKTMEMLYDEWWRWLCLSLCHAMTMTYKIQDSALSHAFTLSSLQLSPPHTHISSVARKRTCEQCNFDKTHLRSDTNIHSMRPVSAPLPSQPPPPPPPPSPPPSLSMHGATFCLIWLPITSIVQSIRPCGHNQNT